MFGRLLGIGALALAPFVPAACHTDDPYTFCRDEREHAEDIITRSYRYRTGGGVFCKAAVPSHDHYHCLRADMDDHSHEQGWSFCYDDETGPYW